MEKQQNKSSFIDFTGSFGDKLFIAMNEKAIYEYKGCSAKVRKGIERTKAQGKSVGKYFNRYIRNNPKVTFERVR